MASREIGWITDAIEMRVEQVRDGYCRGLVIHPLGYEYFSAVDEAGIKSAAIATARNRFPDQTRGQELNGWRDLSDLSDEQWHDGTRRRLPAGAPVWPDLDPGGER